MSGRGRRRLLWTLVPLALLATALCLVIAGVAVHHVSWSAHVEDTRRDLLTRARLVAFQVTPLLDDPSALDPAIKAWGVGSDARLTVIAADGTVLADSGADPAQMENHAGRPEVRQARALGEGWSRHRSGTLGIPMLYVAIRLDGGASAPVLRAAMPLQELGRELGRSVRTLALAGAGVLCVIAALAFVSGRAVARALAGYEEAAERFAAGDFSRRLPVSRWREMAGLGEALNDMASQLDERMKTITRQAGEQNAVLSSMSEGVLAVDAAQRVISMNDAAARLLGVEQGQARGRAIQEVVRHPELEALLARVLRTGEGVEAEIVLGGGTHERHVAVHGTVLEDGRPERHGAVAVLNDVTRLRRLETVRRDFVANVSHELKTPVTSIKGFIETLREGALDDPQRARRFLDIIGRQAERLQAIIDDLLTLSRLEQEGKESEVPRRVAPLRSVLESALQVCEHRAQERGTPVTMSCDDGLHAALNPPLLEQAVVNLVDNAIKHSEAGEPIAVRAFEDGDDVVIEVADQGVGIEPEHLPRLFERFYRVDRARSRKEGGTGLGLAIVKHIVRVHGGVVEVASEPGVGSTFTIRLPSA